MASFLWNTEWIWSFSNVNYQKWKMKQNSKNFYIGMCLLVYNFQVASIKSSFYQPWNIGYLKPVLRGSFCLVFIYTQQYICLYKSGFCSTWVSAKDMTKIVSPQLCLLVNHYLNNDTMVLHKQTHTVFCVNSPLL